MLKFVRITTNFPTFAVFATVHMHKKKKKKKKLFVHMLMIYLHTKSP
jgi:hypothetical protein